MVRETIPSGLSGASVALTGRLASMTRDEAEERIRSAGGRCVATPTPRTNFLVVGQDGPPLGEDGRLTKSLRRARQLQEEGAALRVVGEEELLTLLGLEERHEDLRRLYTTAQLARILEIPAARVRSWVRLELIRPVKVVRRLCFFDFRQVATARWLRKLTENGVTPTRIRKSLEQLAAWLPETSHALSQLEALESEGALVLRTAEGQLAEPSGQLRLDFQEPPDATERTPPPAPHDSLNEGEAWFERGVWAEEAGDFSQAIEAYRSALSSGGPLPEILFNLGNVLYALELKSDAAQYFDRATEVDPEFVEAWNNLGNALSESGRTADGVRAFRRALALEPDYADAHFNLAETLAGAGELEEAREHWRAYLSQDPWSSWADVVRDRLRSLGAGSAGPEGS